MGLRINTNIEAENAARNLQLTSQDFQKAIQRLSSGLRINSAADDPAGNSITQTLTAQVNGFDQAQRNIQDGISMTQVADGALNTVSNALQRLHTLAVQSSTDSLTNTDRVNIQTEVQSLIKQIDQISNQTEFNTKKLLDGSAGGAVVVGGGTDVAQVTAQDAVALTGVYKINAAGVTNATKSAREEVNTIATDLPGGVFTNGGSVTITGGSQSAGVTLTAQAGETVGQFIDQVNAANYGFSISLDTNGKLLIANTGFGNNLPAGDAAANKNLTGPNLVSIAGPTGDFLAIYGAPTTANSVNSAGALQGVEAVNAKISVTYPGALGSINLTGQGSNGDTFSSAGVTIKLNNPGSISGNDQFQVTSANALNIQSSPNSGEAVLLRIDSVASLTLGVTGLNLGTQSTAEAAINTINNAINQVSQLRSQVGSTTNFLTNTLNNAALEQQNLDQARSQIQDVNVATETTQFTRDQILLQAGTSVLAQANQSPTGLLALLH